MNLKEQLAGKVEIIGDLKLAVEGGDESAADALAEALEEAESIKSRIEQAEKANDMLKSLSAPAVKTVAGENPKTLGAFAAKNLDIASIRGKRGASVSTDFYYKAGTQTAVAYSLEEVTTSREIAPLEAQTPIFDALGKEFIDGNAYEWVVMGDTALVSASSLKVLEGERKPEMKHEYGKVTESLGTYAGWFKETEQMLEDNAYLASAIDSRGRYFFEIMREAEIAAELQTILTSGYTLTGRNAPAQPITAQTVTVAATVRATDIADAIADAIAAAKKNGHINPDAVILSSDWARILRTGRDDNGQYYGGGYAQNAYGNGAYNLLPDVWNYPVLESDALTGGVGAIVGNLRAGAGYIGKRNGGLRVTATNSNEDDFIHNLVTVRVEERGLLVVRAPKAFVLVGTE